MIKCGFVALVGKPNAGKSSLINAIIREKVSIVSPKPQTTRNNILGIYNTKDSQIVFIDTPGINKTASGLDIFMQKSVKGAISDVNVILIALDISNGVFENEFNLISQYEKLSLPIIVVLTKIDLVSDAKVFEILTKFSNFTGDVIPLSSKKNRNLKTLIDVILKYLPETKTRYFDEDIYTDRPVKFLVSEIIREKALYLLDKEIPHGIAVDIKSFKENDTIIDIDADIICEKDSHKAIILGKGGEKIKQIGHEARVSIQKVVQKKVNLNIFVKIKPNWKNNLEFLTDLGYNTNNIN